MEIKSFEDLTSYISNEYLKMSECYGMQKPSEKFLKYVENTLLDYPEMYKKPFRKLKKAEIKIVFAEQMMEYKVRYAIVTMPHGKVWKLFHHGLWVRMQEYMKKHDDSEDGLEDEPQKPVQGFQTMVPEVVRPMPPENIGDE